MYRNICISILNLGKNLLQPTADADGLSGQPALFSDAVKDIRQSVLCAVREWQLNCIAYSNPYTSQVKFNSWRTEQRKGQVLG